MLIIIDHKFIDKKLFFSFFKEYNEKMIGNLKTIFIEIISKCS